MPEGFEPKFTPAEIDKKHEEALAMDKEAEEMVAKGEAETPQEAIDKIEEKELEKSPEEMLKEALPLVWEEALEFAKEKGFDNPAEIKKRIDLAKKYNLEVEHFFYDPEKLERETPTREQIEKTAKELGYVNEFAREFSKQSKKPIFCIFNARNGMIYSYGMDTVNSQLNSQFEDVAKKEGKNVQEIRGEFVKDLKANKHWKGNKRMAFMEIAEKWMGDDRLDCFLGQDKITKVASLGFKLDIDMSNYTRDIIRQNHKFLFIDTGYHYEKGPASFMVMGHNLHYINEKYEEDYESDKPFVYHHIRSYIRKKHLDGYLSPKKVASNLLHQKEDCSGIFLDPSKETSRDVSVIETRGVWWDNFPQALGKLGKKFDHWAPLYSTERAIQSAQSVEYLSEKVKNALRYYQKDTEGRNWFERNFEGIMLGKKDAPEKDSKEYLEMFRKWLPYETSAKGKAKLDDKGYPIPRKEASMAVAAGDELARVEAAMEELEGKDTNRQEG